MSAEHRRHPESVPSYLAVGVPTMSDADREERARQSELAEIPDFYVIKAMRSHGGSFESALAKAAAYADDDNLCRIKAAWPEYWAKYTEPALKLWRAEKEEP